MSGPVRLPGQDVVDLYMALDEAIKYLQHRPDQTELYVRLLQARSFVKVYLVWGLDVSVAPDLERPAEVPA